MWFCDDVETPRVRVFNRCGAAKEVDRTGSSSGDVGECCKVDCPACLADTVSTVRGVTGLLLLTASVFPIELD